MHSQKYHINNKIEKDSSLIWLLFLPLHDFRLLQNNIILIIIIYVIENFAFRCLLTKLNFHKKNLNCPIPLKYTLNIKEIYKDIIIFEKKYVFPDNIRIFF